MGTSTDGSVRLHVSPDQSPQPEAGTEKYRAGVAAAQTVNPEEYTRLLQLQELAQQHGYAPDGWGRPSRQQILFILGVCAQFREKKARENHDSGW